MRSEENLRALALKVRRKLTQGYNVLFFTFERHLHRLEFWRAANGVIHRHHVGVVVDYLKRFTDSTFLTGHRIHLGACHGKCFGCRVKFAGAFHHPGAHIIDPCAFKLFFEIVICHQSPSFELLSHEIASEL